MSQYKEPSFEAVEVGETFAPLDFVADERYVRTACFALNDYSAIYMPEAGVERLVPSAAIARDLQQLFLTKYDSNRIVGLHQTEEIEFHGPVPFGSRITLTGRCVDKYERRGKGYFVLQCDACNERDELLVRQLQTEIMSIPEGLSVGGPGTAETTGPQVKGIWPVNRPALARLRGDIAVGTPVQPLQKYCDQNEMSVFSGCGLYRHNVHTDDRVALAAGFRTCVAQGMMETCWMSQMLGNFLGPAWWSRGWLKTKYLKPIYASDSVTLRAVVSASDSSQISFELWAENQEATMTAVGWARFNR